MKKTKKLKKLLSLCLIAVTFVTMLVVPANASVRGGQGTYTMYVTTTSSSLSHKIKLQQSKHVDVYVKSSSGKTKTVSGYRTYTIKYEAVSGTYSGKHSGTVKMTGSTKTISLKKNAKYKFTISYNTYIEVKGGYSLQSCGGSTWSVKSTTRIASYS
ncbi:MAG: hypothetical protein LUG65_01660 [Clostridiales bacterium]|nr:hypothetical protein [Clostridiales bacterium]